MASSLIVRPAIADDAEGISTILTEIMASWNSDRPSHPDQVLQFYIKNPQNIECSVGVGAGGNILGFQSLKLAGENNIWDVTPGWGVIGTYVKIGIERRGTGTALFTATKKAARQFNLSKIDATIRNTNPAGLLYYQAMGFQTYRTLPDMTCKVYTVIT